MSRGSEHDFVFLAIPALIHIHLINDVYGSDKEHDKKQKHNIIVTLKQ